MIASTPTDLTDDRDPFVVGAKCHAFGENCAAFVWHRDVYREVLRLGYFDLFGKVWINKNGNILVSGLHLEAPFTAFAHLVLASGESFSIPNLQVAGLDNESRFVGIDGRRQLNYLAKLVGRPAVPHYYDLQSMVPDPSFRIRRVTALNDKGESVLTSRDGRIGALFQSGFAEVAKPMASEAFLATSLNNYGVVGGAVSINGGSFIASIFSKGSMKYVGPSSGQSRVVALNDKGHLLINWQPAGATSSESLLSIGGDFESLSVLVAPSTIYRPESGDYITDALAINQSGLIVARIVNTSLPFESKAVLLRPAG